MTQIHFIEKLKRHKLMDPHTHTFESGNWRVEAAAAEALVGARIYFHETAQRPHISAARSSVSARWPSPIPRPVA